MTAHALVINQGLGVFNILTVFFKFKGEQEQTGYFPQEVQTASTPPQWG